MKNMFSIFPLKSLSLCIFGLVISITSQASAAKHIDTTASKTPTQPNIILILTDDQPYGYLGITGNKIVKTPNIDELANQGVLFTNAHVSSAICTPSRISILLGQYERKHGVNFNSGTSVSEEAWESSYPMLLRKAGYFTGWVGKNHSPVGKGGYKSGLMEKSFDYWYAGHGHLSFYPKDRHKIFSEAKTDTQLEVVSEGIDDFLDTNEYKFKKAIKFLDSRPTDQPFMLSVNLNLPHGSSTSTMKMKETDDEIYKSLFRDQTLPLPKNYIAKADIKTPKLPTDIHHVIDRQNGYNVVDTPEKFREEYTRQLQAMTGIDRLVGKLKRKLKDQKIDDNTVIIFTSDHGLFMGEQGLGGKALCYEKTTHVPLIIYDPRNKQNNKTSNALVQSIDIAPTLLSLANVKQASTFQGENLMPLYNATDVTAQTKRKYIFSENLWSTHFGNPRCESIQTNEWKYIRYYKNNNLSATKKIALAKQLKIPVNKMLYAFHDNDIAQYREFIEGPLHNEPVVYEELYNLNNDPTELKNVVTDKEYQQQLNTMRKDWYQTLLSARGTEAPKVERFTIDSQQEHNTDIKQY
ncbi:sulfatase-like hydrolase/transferase [Colwellia sp. RE-S-Sl-9]